MKFQLGEKDYLEKYHMIELIDGYVQKNHGKQPEYVIVHPGTYAKILLLTNERNDDFTYPVIQYNYENGKPVTTIYGIAFIRSSDIEEDFVIIA